MSDKKTPLEQALDLFVYAPLGLAMSAREELPKLAEKGRQQVTGQLTMAKMIGQFAVKQGQTEAEKAVKQAVGRIETLANRGTQDAPAAKASAAAASPSAASPSTNGTARTATPAAEATTPAPVPEMRASSAASTSSAPRTGGTSAGGPPKAASRGTIKGPEIGSSTPAGADHLAIPGYDVLSASQVVQRLPGLSTDDLEAVRAYETTTRGRKTILTRIGQLQSGSH